MIYSYVIRCRHNENSFLLEKIKDTKSWLWKKRLFVPLKQSERCLDLDRAGLDAVGLNPHHWVLEGYFPLLPRFVRYHLKDSELFWDWPSSTGKQWPHSETVRGGWVFPSTEKRLEECSLRCFLAPILCPGQHVPSRTSSLLVRCMESVLVFLPQEFIKWIPPTTSQE